jgi:hypothetical protein
VLTPWAALGDSGLSRGAVTQRFESELAPGSRLAALRVRLERRVTADRSFTNFAQTLDSRSARLRWQARASSALSAEVEGRWQRDAAGQSLATGTPYRRVLGEVGAVAQLVFTPDSRLRAAAILDAGWVRPETGSAGDEATRTVRVGPDLGLGIGARGRVELSVRRSFLSGPPPVALVPTIDPAGAPRWEGSVRGDYRVHETTTISTSFQVRDRTGQVLPPLRPVEMTGRVELRAFF